MGEARQAGARIVRLNVHWAGIVGKRPQRPTSPSDPSYDFSGLDVVVKEARRRGLQPILTVFDAPSWAEGKRRPSFRFAPPGTWKPNPSAYGDFARALARRYSGGFRNLPRVRYYQAWNEPNLALYLAPQFSRRRPVAPHQYRRMLNGFFSGVKSVRRSNRVLTGGTSPYGDPPGHYRTQPALFYRTLLCLKGRRALKPQPCRRPAHFDIAAHHPINVGSPTRRALNADDISTPDIGKLSRILRKARRTGRALPRGPKPVWATEIWWDSRPPDPRGVPLRLHARWYQQALYVLWRQKVQTVVLLQVRDAPSGGNFAASLQSGVIRVGGKRKPAFRAVRFPLVADRIGRRKVRVWGKAPNRGRVTVQRRRNGDWKTIARLRRGKDGVFTRVFRIRGRAALRARSGSEKSLVWMQR